MRGLNVEQVEIDKYSGIVDHGYLKYAEMRWNQGLSFRYHTYVIQEGCDMKGAVAFASGDSLGGKSGRYEIFQTATRILDTRIGNMISKRTY